MNAKTQELFARVFALSKADEVQLNFVEEQVTHLRYGDNQPTTSGSYASPTLGITSAFGKRSGSASTNQFDADSLELAVRRSEEIARLLPEDPESLPLLEPQQYLKPAEHQLDSNRVPSQLARGVSQAIELAKQSGVAAAGFAHAVQRNEALATSRGLRAAYQSSRVSLTQTSRTLDGSGSGWAGRAADDPSQLNFVSAAKTSIDKALLSQKPRAIPAGKYTTILEPDGVASLMRLLVGSMDARSADEGRSFFASPGARPGDALFGPEITLYSDPLDARVPARPFHTDGRPHSKRFWVQRGTVGPLHAGRFWAQKQSIEAIAPDSNLILSGGDVSTEQLIAATDRGLLVTRLWYIRSVDERTLLFTGLTRDGVFMIEGGRITYPVKNLRWNDSPVRMLKNVDGMSVARRVLDPWGWSYNMTDVFMPALRIRDFEFTSTTEAV